MCFKCVFQAKYKCVSNVFSKPKEKYKCVSNVFSKQNTNVFPMCFPSLKENGNMFQAKWKYVLNFFYERCQNKWKIRKFLDILECENLQFTFRIQFAAAVPGHRLCQETAVFHLLSRIGATGIPLLPAFHRRIS